ncbi:MAG: LysM peptidoglycan-binding domain-containing protein [Actinomycetota bacterium]|nr:LysM peptidoglycan-binding domain-containing protein [Actinomycetota bacterium]
MAALAVAGSAATGSYTVRRGDTVSDIAKRHAVSARSIVVANGLTDPHRVIAGKTLQIPGSKAAPAAATGGASYKVRSGDTLSDIALRLGVTTGALARANGITQPNRLAAGRTLSVPAGAGTGAAASGGAPATSSSGLPARLRANPTRLAYIPTFQRWAAHYGVPADLLMAMTWLESGWQQGAVSSTGAVGIGQIMPDTTAWMRDHVIGEPLDPRSVDDNIRMSARYLRWLLDRTGGDVRLALGGYYQGLASVRTRGLLAETERYVADITTLRSRF